MKDISVVIPLYNLEKYIERAIYSVLNQKILPKEIIVVNDGSTDNGAEIVRNMQNPLIHLINQPNQGVAVARNKGIEEAKGEFIAFLDGDDEWMENHLEVICQLIKNYPECDIYATSFYFVKNEIKAGLVQPQLNPQYLFKEYDGVIDDYYGLISKSINLPFNSDTIVIKKSIIPKAGEFPLGVKTGEDIYYWAKLYAFGDIAYSKIPTAYYYIGVQGKPSRFRINNLGDVLCDNLIDVASHRKHVKKFVAFWYKNRMVCALLLPSYTLALKMFFRAVKLDPLEKKIYISLFKSLLSTFKVNKHKK